MTKSAAAITLAALAAGLQVSSPTSAAAASHGPVSLANPAAAYCVETGGSFTIKEVADGQRGVCILPDGQEIDAWDHYRAFQAGGAQLANPAAVFCADGGRTYDRAASTCALPGGETVDAWDHFRKNAPKG